MTALDPDKRRRLIASARLLESSNKGEREAALEAMLRLLPDGVTIAALIEKAIPPVVAVPPMLPWQRVAAGVCAVHELFSDKELEFALNIRERRRPPTEKQWEWLNDLAARADQRVAA